MDSDKRRFSFLNWFFNRPRLSGFLVFLLVFIMSIYIVYQRHRLNEENYSREMHNLLEVAYSNVDQSLKNASNNALTLALTLNNQGLPENFDEVGAQILKSNKGIDAVQLVPGGKINYIYPLQGNELAVGYDILNDPRHRPDLLKTIALNKMYFAGPFALKQGGVGIVGRLPVYQHNRFWGFSAVVIRLETLLKDTGMKAIDDTRYSFQLSLFDHKTRRNVFFMPLKETFENKYVSERLISDTNWTLYIISKEEKSAMLYTLVPLFLFGLIFSALLGYTIALLLKKPQQLRTQVRKQAEKILESEAKFRTMFEQAAIGIANIDSISGQFLQINKVYCELLGYTTAEMHLKKFIDFSHPDDLPADLLLMERLRNGEIRDYSHEIRLIDKDGQELWVNLTVSPLWKAGEKPTTHIAVVEDITIEKQAKEEIRKNEARFKSLFDDSPVALWEEDFSLVKECVQHLNLEPNHEKAVAYFNANPDVVKKCMELVRIIDVNNECLALHYPRTKAELLKGLHNLMDDYTSEVFILQLAAIVTEQPKFTAETKVIMDCGNIRDISLGWNVMRGHESLLDRVIVSTEDITDQKASQRIILNSRQRLENLINTIEGIVWECDADTLEQHFISKKTKEILGYTDKEWLADEYFWRKHLHPDDLQMAVDAFIATAENKKEGVFEYRMVTKNKGVVWIRDIVSIVHENGRNIIRGIMIDITANKEAEEVMNRSFELIGEHKKRLMNFSYIVSHNLRSHAANIQSIVQFLDSGDCNAEQREMVDMLKTVSNSLNDTMYNLNDLVNIQANDNLTTETLNLRDYIGTSVELLAGQIEEKNARVIVEVGPDVEVNYNAAYLESILHNLISNALRYSSPDRPPIINIGWNDNAEKSLAITDNGIGIDLQRHGSKLFGMYKTFNGNPDARGIGLFMTKSQVETMGGKISADSQLGHGTTFMVTFR